MIDPIDIEKHVIIIDGNGLPLRPDAKPHSKMSTTEFYKYTEEILSSISDQKKQSGNRKILFYVHGGLTSYSSSLRKAKALAPKMISSGYYPIFINWRSGLVNSYFEQLFKVRQGRIHRKNKWITWLYIFISDLGRAIFRLPIAIYLQLINDCKSYLPNMNPDGKNSDAIYKVLRKRFKQNSSNSIGVSLGKDVRTRREKVVQLIILFLLSPIKGVIGAVVDAFGSSAWKNMLRRTKVLFRNPAEFDIRDRFTDEAFVESSLDIEASGALSVFLRAFIDKIQSSSNTDEVVLVGHSMGTIVINRMLIEFPELRCARIVYMGAACSILEFADSVIPYLNNYPDTHFVNLCLHPVAEVSESNYLELPPRGSLLIWIDNFLSSPETTLDRRLGVWENVLQTTHVLPESLRPRIALKGFGVGKNATIPKKHGQFNEAVFWEEDFWLVGVSD